MSLVFQNIEQCLPFILKTGCFTTLHTLLALIYGQFVHTFFVQLLHDAVNFSRDIDEKYGFINFNTKTNHKQEITESCTM